MSEVIFIETRPSVGARRGSEDLWISPPEQTSEENLNLC